MASHDLINVKTTILGATPGAILGIDGHPPERFSLAPVFSARFFKNWGVPARKKNNTLKNLTSLGLFDTRTWSFPSVSSLSDYSIWRS